MIPSEEDKALELILQYGMDEIEAKAFKIACIYLERAKKFFPDYKHYRLPKGDPRKSDLFRHCYKLLREKGSKIADEDYKLYIHAQMDILRGIKKGDLHPYITPACISGDKAWKRWLLWKGRYDKMIESKMSKNNATAVNVHNVPKIKKDLWKTKQFFIAWFDRLDPTDVLEALKDNNLFRWYQTGNVCGYYLYISPLVQKWLRENSVDLKKEFHINLNLYKDANQEEVVAYFRSEFPHEKIT